MRTLRGPAALAAVLLLAACSRPAATVTDLRMPAEAHPGIAALSTRAEVVDGDEAALPKQAETAELLRKAGLTGSASYRYRLAPPGKGRYKVRIDLFVDEARAQENWANRHMPEALAMTQPFAVGDQGWIWRDQMAGFRIGRAIIEIRAADGAQGMPDFARRYAGYAAAALDRGGPAWWERGPLRRP
ncbi:MAG TPA: hypothetical protein VFV11_01950 [Solimonas sp.]|nr:hypothetical protein [Solimonas sp.]